MRRERSQSSDRGRPHVPRWDNPSGQLPGTGIPSGIDSGLYGFSHGTSRRRDSSVPERSRVRTSESGVSAGGSRRDIWNKTVGSLEVRMYEMEKTMKDMKA